MIYFLTLIMESFGFKFYFDEDWSRWFLYTGRIARVYTGAAAGHAGHGDERLSGQVPENARSASILEGGSKHFGILKTRK